MIAHLRLMPRSNTSVKDRLIPHCASLTKACSSICKFATDALDAKSATGKRGPPANVAFGGTLTATRPRVPAGTLGNSQPGSPARARPRQVTYTPDCNMSLGLPWCCVCEDDLIGSILPCMMAQAIQ